MTLSTTNASESAKALVRPVVLHELQLGALMLRGCDGPASITYAGNSYSPLTWVLGINGVQDSKDGKGRAVSFKFSALDDSIRAAVLNAGSAFAFGAVRVYLGFLNEQYQLIDAPERISAAYTSQARVTVGSEDNSIEVTCELRTVLLRRDSRQLASPTGQRQRYAGDTGLDAVIDVPSRQITWGGGTFRIDTPTRGRTGNVRPNNGGDYQ